MIGKVGYAFACPFAFESEGIRTTSSYLSQLAVHVSPSQQIGSQFEQMEEFDALQNFKDLGETRVNRTVKRF
jgi:hypothetical protein